MALSKNRKIIGVLSIVVFVLALTLMIVDWAVPLNLLTHPILNFVGVLFFGFGVLAFVLSIKQKSPWYLFLSAILLGLTLLYVLLNLIVGAWWIAVVCVVAFWAICAILSIVLFGNKTEDIALNKSPEYQNYEQRKENKINNEQVKEEETLPEIKSFKD